MTEPTPTGEANEADRAEQQLPAVDDEEPPGELSTDADEVNPADAAEQALPVSEGEEYPHQLESSIDEA
jgi:hypothetical protein